MNPRLGIAFAALLLVSPSAAASEVCILFVEQHLDDPSWEQACLEWMFSHEQSAPSAANAQTIESGVASASSVTVLHASESDLTLAADNQNEAFIAVDPSPAGAGRAFVISRTAPFAPSSQRRLFAAYSTDYGTTWTPTTIALDPDGPIPPGRGGAG